ncbi:MAG: beta-hydroxyacyl-ACP dehydratase [Gammaproteobacteria bacterium]|jgi:3-hydroxyacyl-[acyl-carrier-protein] dehydratase|nr:beta-hydroxyacyl-ACP dehydratase [Gammaproteobacteria bacterium]
MIDIHEILSFLPHRYPFILVDRVLELKESGLVGLKNVTINEPFFTGHFPEQPVMPGVMIIEALAQAAGIFILKSDPTINKESSMFLLAGIDNARFKRIVLPGDQLYLHIDLIRKKQGIYKFKCEAIVDGEIACTAELMNARRGQNDT